MAVEHLGEPPLQCLVVRHRGLRPASRHGRAARPARHGRAKTANARNWGGRLGERNDRPVRGRNARGGGRPASSRGYSRAVFGSGPPDVIGERRHPMIAILRHRCQKPAPRAPKPWRLSMRSPSLERRSLLVALSLMVAGPSASAVSEPTPGGWQPARHATVAGVARTATTSFTDVGAGLQGVYNSSVAWGTTTTTATSTSCLPASRAPRASRSCIRAAEGEPAFSDAGAYLVRMTAAGNSWTRKLVLAR